MASNVSIEVIAGPSVQVPWTLKHDRPGCFGSGLRSDKQFRTVYLRSSILRVSTRLPGIDDQ
jgi:hypothetical protein